MLCLILLLISFGSLLEGYLYHNKFLNFKYRNKQPYENYNSMKLYIHQTTSDGGINQHYNVNLGDSMLKFEWDSSIEQFLFDLSLSKTMEHLKKTNRFEYIWFHKLITIDEHIINVDKTKDNESNDLSIEEDVSNRDYSKFNKLAHILIEKDIERLCLYKDSEVNPKLSITMRININPRKVLEVLLKKKMEAFEDLIYDLSRIKKEHEDCLVYMNQLKTEDEATLKKRRKSIYPPDNQTQDFYIFQALNLYITNQAIMKCKDKYMKETQKDITRNIIKPFEDLIYESIHMKTIDNLLINPSYVDDEMNTNNNGLSSKDLRIRIENEIQSTTLFIDKLLKYKSNQENFIQENNRKEGKFNSNDNDNIYQEEMLGKGINNKNGNSNLWMVDEETTLSTSEEEIEEEDFEQWLSGQKRFTSLPLAAQNKDINNNYNQNQNNPTVMNNNMNIKNNLPDHQIILGDTIRNNLKAELSLSDSSVMIYANYSDDLMYYRNILTAQLNLTLLMMNATYELGRKINNLKLSSGLEGWVDENYPQLLRMNREVYIKSKGFQLDNNSTDLYYIIDDPNSNNDNDSIDQRIQTNDIDDNMLDDINVYTSYLRSGSSDQDGDNNDISNNMGSGRVGWAVTGDNSQTKTGSCTNYSIIIKKLFTYYIYNEGAKFQGQKLLVSLKDPPNNQPPPPDYPPKENKWDEEDENNRKNIDFGDIGYTDIKMFYNLPSHAMVRFVDMMRSSEDGEQYICLEAKIFNTINNNNNSNKNSAFQIIRKWVKHQDGTEFLLKGTLASNLEKSTTTSTSGIVDKNKIIVDDTSSSTIANASIKSVDKNVDTFTSKTNVIDNNNNNNNNEDDINTKSPFYGGTITLM